MLCYSHHTAINGNHLTRDIGCFIRGQKAYQRGDFTGFTASDLAKPSTLWSYATGVALIVAVASLFKALSLGPATEVVPIYGMFVVGGALLGIIFLNEPLTNRKLLGIAFAALSIYLIAK